MPTLRRTAVREAAVAREQVAPALQKAQETLTDTVLPAVRDALAIAREKSVELLDSDAALEAKRRGLAVVQAARGNTIPAPTRARRWRFGLGMMALGAGAVFGAGFAKRWLARPLTATEAEQELAAGTEGGTGTTSSTTAPSTSSSTAANGAAPSTAKGAKTGGIDLRAGSPTKP